LREWAAVCEPADASRTRAGSTEQRRSDPVRFVTYPEPGLPDATPQIHDRARSRRERVCFGGEAAAGDLALCPPSPRVGNVGHSHRRRGAEAEAGHARTRVRRDDRPRLSPDDHGRHRRSSLAEMRLSFPTLGDVLQLLLPRALSLRDTRSVPRAFVAFRGSAPSLQLSDSRSSSSSSPSSSSRKARILLTSA
jgi:hypothetical protein